MQTTLPVGTIIRGRYLVQGLLGKGRFGAVYLVRDRHIKRNFFNLLALKEVFNPHKYKLYQIALEGMTLRLLHHQALPHVYNVISDGNSDRIYILMDYIEGRNLEMLRLQQPEKGFPLPEVMTIMAPIMDAVSYLHSQQPPIIHQDIKPTNVIVPHASDTVVLVDFGIAKKYNLDPTNAEVGCSLTGYEAPEQYGGEINTRTDIYGLGATFYTLLTGLVPVDALSRKARVESKNIDPLEPVNQVVPTISMFVAETIQRAMFLSSNDRFSTIEQFQQALKSVSTWQQSLRPDLRPRAKELDLPLKTNPTKQRSPEHSIAPSTASQPSIAPEQPAARPPAPLSRPEPTRAKPLPPSAAQQPATRPAPSPLPEPAGAKPTHPPAPEPVVATPASPSVPKRPYILERSRKLAVLLPILLVLLLGMSVGAALLYSVLSHHTPGSVTSTPTPLSKATPAPHTPTVASTPISSSTPSANLASSYNGTIYDIPGHVTTDMSLTSIQQNQGNISGYFTGLLMNGPFAGTFRASRHIQFTVTDSAKQIALSFDGVMQTDGNLTGTYCNLNQQRQCAGDYGIWSAGPAS